MFITENKEILKRRRKKPKKKITNNIINQRDIQLLLTILVYSSVS